MKRILSTIAVAMFMAGPARATSVAFDSAIANTVLTSTSSYLVDMSKSPVDLLSAQATVSSATPTAQTFSDGRPSTATLTVLSTATLAGAQATDTITVATNSSLVATAGTNTLNVTSTNSLTGATITLGANGNMLVFTQGYQWAIGASTTTTAASIASALNNQRYWTATSAGSTVTVTCVTPGIACNSYTLADSTPTVLSVGGATFSGGLDNSSFTINTQAYIQGIDWFQAALSSNTAVNIANAINSLDSQGVTASTTSSTVVTITAKASGTVGNSLKLSGNSAGLTLGGASFSGGVNVPYLLINGVKLTEGAVQGPGVWALAGTSSGTAVNISSAIANTPALSAIIVSTAPNGQSVVFATSTATGLNAYTLFSSNANVLPSAGQFGNGLTQGYAAASGLISLPSHGLSTGMAVLFSTGSGVALTPLVNQTTYYIIAVDANDVQVSTTQALALAGTRITPLSTTAAGSHNFTLSPLALSGSVTLTWQGSNDNTNWANLSVAAMLFASPYASASTVWDFGAVNLKYIRANVAGPTQGGANLLIRAFGKRYGSGL